MSDYNYKDVYEQWVNNPLFGQETKDELLAIKDDEKEIEERFYCDLVFGTAGLRGIIGAGTNRMNIYVVRKATQGLANYIIKAGKQDKGVAIAYDSRRMSPEFSMEAALCLAANGIKAYRFESLRPTPELSFAVRYLDCVAGINVTASHNPPEYNGYKVYWEDGAQITPPHDQGIMAEVKAITDFADTKTMDMVEAKKKGLLVTIGSEVDDAYMGELKKLILNQDAIDKYGKDLKIVYTPLHGTGNIPVRRSVSRMYMWYQSRSFRMESSQLLSIQTQRQRKHLHLHSSWQRRSMQISFLQQTQMPTDSDATQRIPRQVSTRCSQEICQEAYSASMR